MTSYIQELLLYQIIIILSFVMIISKGCVFFIIMKGQHRLIDVSSTEQYSTLVPPIMEKMKEYFAAGDKDYIRESLQKFIRMISNKHLMSMEVL